MKISVLTPSYNSGHTIENAIKSVLEQKYDNFEHIIVDNNSTDNTKDIVKKYPHVTYISEKDNGQSDAMNKAFRLSNGEIICYLNADDIFSPGTFSKVVDFFKDSPKSKVIIGDIIIDYLGKIEERTPSTKYWDVLMYWKDLFPPNPVCYFYKREVQESYGSFPVDNHYTMDIDFLLFMYKNYSIQYLKHTFGTFILDGNNKTANHNVRLAQKNIVLGFLKKYDYINYLILLCFILAQKIRRKIMRQ